MLNLWLLLLVVGITLMALIWIGALFLQSYLYTMPSQQLLWQAPAAALVITAFYAWWCIAVATFPGANPANNIPYDAIHRFSPNVYMSTDPVKELWAVKKNGELVKYKSHRVDQIRYVYKDQDGKPWRGTGVVAIEIQHEGTKYKFEPATTEIGGYPTFKNDKGWSMRVHEYGPTGNPLIFRTGRFLANLFFNGMHLAIWFVALWLGVRFQWSHALLIAFCMWLLFTLAILPMMLGFAARIAQAQPIPVAV